MKKATFDPSKRLDLYFRINRNGSKAFSFFNVSGTARSLIYEEYSLVIRKFQGGPVYITLPLTIDTNVITATITESQSRINEGEYYWELIRVDLGKTWLNGKAVFHNGVFDGVDTDTTDITIAESTETINITISESGTGGSDPIVYTSGNAVEVGTDNKVGWGNQFTKNTSIPGASVNVELGTTGSRLNRFLFRVADLFEVLMPTGGTWRAIVGTSQLLVNNVAIGMLHDKLIQFQDGASNAILNIITENDGNGIVPEIQAKVPIKLQVINDTAVLEALDSALYEGAIVYQNFNGHGLLFSNGERWADIIQYTLLEVVTTTATSGTGLTIMGDVEIGTGPVNKPKPYDKFIAVWVVELLSTTSTRFFLRVGTTVVNTTIFDFTIAGPSPGIYTITAEVLVLPDLNTQHITVNINGIADTSSAYHVISNYSVTEITDVWQLDFRMSTAVNAQAVRRLKTFEVYHSSGI
jgi:hypothetical protein